MSTPALPQHIGIIMDGNGRWAKSRRKPRTAGHQEGVKVAKRIVTAARDAGIPYISLYAFSTENWKRAQEEVSFLINLIHNHIRKELDYYREKSVRITHSGDMSGLPKTIQKDLHDVMQDTKDYNGITVNLAINYGGRNEIMRAAQKICMQHSGRDFSQSPLTEEDIKNALDSSFIPDPDLIIRTGGEMRLSNFLLWGSAYSELYFCDKLWPDFNETDFDKAIQDFQQRQRRFGGTC